MSEAYFQYGELEIEYLKKRDKRMAEVIEQAGMIHRRVIPDLFAALVHSIVGQQISTKAHETIWQRMEKAMNGVSADKVCALSDDELRQFGISYRKVAYIKRAAEKICRGEFDIESLYDMDDGAVARKLCELDGIGIWSAEMLMLFSMQRQDILSFGDYAIQRGLRMIYHHRKIDRKLFEKYRRKFSPYNSVASLYIWAVAGGLLKGYKDYAPKGK